MHELGAAIDGVRDTLDARATLVSGGWIERRSGSVTTLEKSAQGSVAVLLQEIRGHVRHFSSLHAEGTFGGMSLSVGNALDSPFISAQSPGDTRQTFEKSQQEFAARAWSGDAGAALKLSGTWRVSISSDLTDPLKISNPGIDWHVLPAAEDLENEIQRVDSWHLRPLFDNAKPTMFLVENLDDRSWIFGGRFAVTGLQSDVVAQAISNFASSRTETKGALRELPAASAPEALEHELGGSSDLEKVSAGIWQACAAMSWASMASSLAVSVDGSLQVQIFGLQRVTHEIARAGLSLSNADCENAYAIHRWVQSSPGVDKLLAVQQVASLYRDTPPWTRNSDVFEAAQAVYNQMQRGTVAEVMQARRSARTMALDLTNRTADATSAMTRSTAERCVATLLGVLAVAVAQTTQVISVEVAQSLRLLLAAALIGLVAWNVFMEGPPLSASLRALSKDMPKVADLISDSERAEILGLTSVSNARRSAIRTRVAVPIVYAIVAGLALFVQV
jgi:hypothetical protein